MAVGIPVLNKLMTPDPKWLEILKASGWQTTALAVAFGLFLLAGRTGWLPSLDPWVIQLGALAFLVCGCLAVANMGAAVVKFFPIQKWLKFWIDVHRNKRQIIKYIPYMTPKEREIIAYLLANNQTTFIAAADGGHAATLLARGGLQVQSFEAWRCLPCRRFVINPGAMPRCLSS
jgi:hypothetical protein